MYGQEKFLTREEAINKLLSDNDVRVEQIEDGIFKIIDKYGYVTYRNFNDYFLQLDDKNSLVYSPNFDSTEINLYLIDTMLYYNMYKFWRKVPVSLQSRSFLIDDINKNGKVEMYGMHYKSISIYEMNDTYNFDSVYTYPPEYFDAISIYDVNSDGNKEILLVRSIADKGSLRFIHEFYCKENQNSFATKKFSISGPFLFGGLVPVWGDFDKDGILDMLTTIAGGGEIYFGILFYEFNPILNNFDLSFMFDYGRINAPYIGFPTGDFDKDGYLEFFAGNKKGKVICLENAGNNNYELTWQGKVETYNAYLSTQTNDLDNNGKDEIWIGGDAFFYGVPKTRLFIFEPQGNNQYSIVGRIDIIGLFTLTGAFNMFSSDLDNDGKQEVILASGNFLFVFKFTGSINHQIYDLFYFRPNENTLQGQPGGYYGATTYDFDKDNYPEIVIGMVGNTEYKEQYRYSFIYKQNFASKNKEMKANALETRLLPNYPNPFNSQTQIRFSLKENSLISLKVFNIMGEEVKTLLEDYFQSGEYSILWDGKDGKGKLLPSGIYFIKLITDSKQFVQKSILLK